MRFADRVRMRAAHHFRGVLANSDAHWDRGDYARSKGEFDLWWP